MLAVYLVKYRPVTFIMLAIAVRPAVHIHAVDTEL